MRSLKRYAMALFCAIPLALLAAACSKQIAVVCSYHATCTDGKGSPTGPDIVIPPGTTNTVVTRPGDLNLFGTCVGPKARLTWTASERADGYFIERRLWTTGPWVRLSKFYNVSERINVEVDADPSAANYWRIAAVNAAGENYSRSPEERDDKTATFACGPPAPPPIATPSPGPNPGPSPTPGPSPGPGGNTPTPPAVNVCTGSGAFSPFGATGHQGTSLTVTITGGCSQRLTTSAPDNVRLVNNGSTATITFRSPGEDSQVCNGQGACATFRTIP